MWKYYDEFASGSAARRCLFILSEITVFSALLEDIFMFLLNIFFFLPGDLINLYHPHTEFGWPGPGAGFRGSDSAPLFERWQNKTKQKN